MPASCTRVVKERRLADGTYSNITRVEINLCTYERGWFSGRIVPCHGTDPGSIPGSRNAQLLQTVQAIWWRSKFDYLLQYTTIFTIAFLMTAIAQQDACLLRCAHLC